MKKGFGMKVRKIGTIILATAIVVQTLGLNALTARAEESNSDALQVQAVEEAPIADDGEESDVPTVTGGYYLLKDGIAQKNETTGYTYVEYDSNEFLSLGECIIYQNYNTELKTYAEDLPGQNVEALLGTDLAAGTDTTVYYEPDVEDGYYYTKILS